MRIGVSSYDPRHHVKQPTVRSPPRLGAARRRYQGNWFPHRLRAADRRTNVLFVGDSAGHCFPLSGEGIRTAFYFGIAAGRELRAVLAGGQTRERRAARYAAFHGAHAPAFRRALASSAWSPRCPRAC